MKQAACLLVLVCTLLADQAIAANRQQNKLNTTTAQQTLNRADLPEHYSAQFDAALVAYVDQSIDLAELCVRYRLADEARSHLDVVKLLVNRPTMQDALTKINPRLASAEASLAQLDAEIAADASQQKTYLDSSTGRRKLEIVQKQAEQKLVPAFAGAIDKLVIELKESNHPGLVKFIVLDLVSLGIAEDQARRMVGYVHHDTLGWVEAGLLEQHGRGLSLVEGHKWVKPMAMMKVYARESGQPPIKLPEMAFTVNAPEAEPEQVYQRLGLAYDKTQAYRKPYDIADLRCYAYVPPHYTGREPFGLVIHMNTGEEGYVQHHMRRNLRSYNMISLSPHDGQNKASIIDRRIPAAIDLVRNAQLRFNIDPERIYITGLGDFRDNVAPTIALAYADIFKGGCFYGDLTFPEPLSKNVPDRDKLTKTFLAQPYVVCVGTKSYNYNQVKSIYPDYEALGMQQLRLIEIPGMEHKCPNSPEPYSQIIRHWLGETQSTP